MLRKNQLDGGSESLPDQLFVAAAVRISRAIRVREKFIFIKKSSGPGKYTTSS